MSTSTTISSPVELTPPATSYQADDDDGDDEGTSLRTPASDSDSNSGFTGEPDGYELRSLSRSGRVAGVAGVDDGDDAIQDDAGEHGALIARAQDSDEDEGDVVYDAFRESDEENSLQLRRRQRRLRGRRKEFLYTREEEKKVIRKFDWNLVGFLALLYMLSFLDRSNIGNAKIAGMTEDLEMTSSNYEWLLTVFYMTYISFEWMTLCYKVFPAHTYIACCVMCWGIVASMQGLTTNWWHMLVLRALLGISEAAFGPGIPFYLSLFYRREELALRCGLFVSAAPLATAYAGFLAYGITSVPSPIAPWRLLFILEGFPSMVAAVAAYYIIPDLPADARFLTADEKKIARRRLLVVTEGGEDTGVMREEEEMGVKWREVLMALRDVGNWVTAAMYFFCNIAFSSLPVFLPTIINDMGYSSTHAQALCVPPYIFAFIIVLLSTYLSDRFLSRSVPIITLCIMGALGYFILATTGSLQASIDAALTGVERVEETGDARWWEEMVPQSEWIKNEAVGVGVKYAGFFLAAGGVFGAIALVMVWNLNNGESESGRGAGIAMLQVIGQCGPLLGTRLYPKEDGPNYVKGMAICSASLVAVCALAMLQRWRLKMKNRRTDRKNAMEGRPLGSGFQYIL